MGNHQHSINQSIKQSMLTINAKNYSMVKTAEQRIYCWRTFRLHFAEFNNLPMEE
jgi:hypothetical protein